MPDKDTRALFEIFDACFPVINISPGAFEKMLCHESSYIITERLNDTITGFSAVRDNSIILLCVAPDFQYSGIGTKLLHESEKFIRESGYSTAVLGRDPACFFMGAVIDNFSHRFFMKHGYYAYNGCLSMSADLSTVVADCKSPLTADENISFRLDCCEREEIEYAVNAVEPRWLRCYKEPGHIVTAHYNDHIAGFSCISLYTPTLVSSTDEFSASIDFVGVLPEYRNRGIGRSLVGYSLRFQKESGCKSSFIRYTSKDEWYKKSGFEEFIWYWLGEKMI